MCAGEEEARRVKRICKVGFREIIISRIRTRILIWRMIEFNPEPCRAASHEFPLIDGTPSILATAARCCEFQHVKRGNDQTPTLASAQCEEAMAANNLASICANVFIFY